MLFIYLKLCFYRYRGTLLPVLTDLARAYPEETLLTIVPVAVSMVSRFCAGDASVDVDAAVTVLDHIFEGAFASATPSGAVAAKALPALFGPGPAPLGPAASETCVAGVRQLLGCSPASADAASALVSTLRAVFSFTASAEGLEPLCEAIADRAISFVAFLSPGETLSAMSMDTAAARRKAAAAVSSLARRLVRTPRLLGLLGALHTRVTGALGTGLLLPAERVSLSEALAAVLPCITDATQRAAFAESLVAPAEALAAPALQQAASRGPGALLAVLAGDPGLRTGLEHAASLLARVLARADTTDALQRPSIAALGPVCQLLAAFCP